MAPPPGTPLKCALAGGFVADLAHSGVYLGDGAIAELDGGGVIKAVSVSEFLNGACGEWEVAVLRTGFRVYAACDRKSGEPLASPDVAAAARAAIEKAGRTKRQYDLLLNNCHRFTTQCVERGGGESNTNGEDGGIWMLERLEEAVSRVLNQGSPICWRPISPLADGFRYAVTQGKRIQHHLLQEGTMALLACAVGIAVRQSVGRRREEAKTRKDAQGV